MQIVRRSTAPVTTHTSSRRRSAGALCATVLLVPLAACGGTPTADVAIADAVAEIRAENTGRFVNTLEASGSPLLRSEGDYDLDAGASSWTTTYDTGDERSTTATVQIGNQLFTQPDTSAGPCWFSEELPAGYESIPGAVRMALQATARDWATEGITAVGATSMHAAVATLGDLASDVTLGPTDQSIPASIQFDEKSVTALRTTMADILSAVRQSGGATSALLEPFGAKGLDVTVLAGFSRVGEEVSISAPDPAVVVVVGTRGAKKSDAALADCNTKAD
ncbi:hypothetical protein [Nocardioides yefusunii]|uniref:Lipoprotein n=1 Tax=Nocardioides yefusunii TaxID=2500546 RepID=A0ABW1R203_9ACTN|nr:hypothetical protein [Nocardioides yefusunii]